MEVTANNDLLVPREHIVTAITILTERQGHPSLSEFQINMVQEMVLNHNSLNQLPTGKKKSLTENSSNRPLFRSWKDLALHLPAPGA